MACRAPRAKWCSPDVRRGDGQGAKLRGVGDSAVDDRLDLRQGPFEAGAREAVEERGEVRRFPRLEAAGEEGAVRRLEAGPHRPIRRLRLKVHRTGTSRAMQLSDRLARSVQWGDRRLGLVGSR